jgi:hypothetical protein
MIQAAIHAILALAAFGEKIGGLASLLNWLRRVLDEYFGGLLPGDLLASVLDRRVKAGHRRDGRQPDPNFGRCRASDQWRFPPSFPAAA